MLRRALTGVARPAAAHAQATRAFASPAQTAFEKAQAAVKTLKDEPDSSVKLEMYGLFKQANSGDVSGARPGMMDFVGRAKFDAWAQLKGTSKEDAMSKYAAIVAGLVGEQSAATPAATVDGLTPADGVDVSIKGRVFSIRLNRPKKKNSLTYEMYKAIGDALRHASDMKETSVTVISAEGDFFSSGNDLTNFTKAATASADEVREMAETAGKVLKEYIDAYINHNKPLIVLANGPGVGIAITIMPLCDMVIASDTFWCQTPFAQLGQSPEGASSYTFPLVMGPVKAAEVLLMGRKLSAQQALDLGLVSMVVPKDKFEEVAWQEVEKMASLPPESLRLNKILLRDNHRAALMKANEDEVKLIIQRWQSKECKQALTKFFTRK